jgi:hypothetical protein
MNHPSYPVLVMFLLILGFTSFSFAQLAKLPIPETKVDSLRNDFIVFRNTLEQRYPSLYRYNNKKAITALFDSCYTSIQPATTPLQFYTMIKYLLGAIKDGHLYAGSPAAMRKYMNEQETFFPVKLHFINNKAYILQAVNSSLQPGTEIVSINEQPINLIKKELFKYIVSDGNIESKKYYVLNGFFHIYYFLVYGPQTRFNITYKSTQELKNITLAAGSQKKIADNNSLAVPEKLLQFSVTNNIGLLTIKTFDSADLEQAHENFRSFLEQSFNEMKQQKINRLIIDLRGNGGGRDLYGSLLYSYLTSRPFLYYKNLVAATKNLPYNLFKSSGSSYNNLNPNLLDSIAPHYFTLKKQAHNNLQLQQPAANHFNGKVFILINGLCFSTTAEFCSVAKSNSIATFIGEETGGGYNGNTSPQTDTVLPHTGILISYGNIEYHMAVRSSNYRNRGILPDYSIKPAIHDIMQKRDVQLQYALQLAAKK